MKRRRGFSLVEIMMTVTIMGMVIAGTSAITINMIRSYNWTSTQLDSDKSASIGIQHVARDLQEAKQVTVISPHQIRVYYPQVAGDGSYIQSALDSVNTIDFYRGTTSGTVSSTGTALVRKAGTGAARVICRNVTDVQFSSLNAGSVEVTLATRNKRGLADAKTQMVQRAIFMRNH